MLTSGAISKIALIFVADGNFDDKMNATLSIVGQRLGVSRCYLFMDSEDGTTISNTHEWCNEGVESQMRRWQSVSHPIYAPLWSILETKSVYAVSDVYTLPKNVCRMLRSEGILSILLAPLCVEDRVRGFLGFDECVRPREWSKVEVETLKTISGIVSAAYSRKILSEKLSASEENFRSFFNTVEDIIVIADQESRLLFANEWASWRLGYSLEEFRKMRVKDLHPPDKRKESEKILREILRKERTHCPVELATKDGVSVPVETRIWFGSWDGRECLFGLSKDLSSEQAALQKFERLFRNNPAPMAVSRADNWSFVDVNDAFIETFGYERKEVLGSSGMDLRLFVASEHWQRVQKALQKNQSLQNYEMSFRRKDGGLIYGLLSCDMIDSQGHRLILSVMIDITEKKAMEERIRELAIRDPLTDLYNRRYIFARLEELVAEFLRRSRNFCISILDIDHFKRVNDTYGHPAGDFILREFSGILRSNIRQYDLVGRYGGEEFIVVSLNAGAREVNVMIERIQSIVRAKSFVFGGHEIPIRFSCGIADSTEFSEDGFSSESIVSRADDRLYAAKADGRDRCVGPR